MAHKFAFYVNPEKPRANNSTGGADRGLCWSPPQWLKWGPEKGFSNMCKKLCIAVGAVIVGLLLITVTGAGTLLHSKYVQWKGEYAEWQDKQIPPETKLKMLNEEIAKIDKDIKKHL